MERVRAGDEDAFREFFEATSPTVLGLLLRLTGSRGLADELVLEVYVQAWRQRDRFDPLRGSPLAWLLALARTRAIDRLRARARDRVVVPDDDDWLADLASLDEPAGLGLQREDEDQRLHAALRSLPTEQGRALAAAYFGGLSHSAIAERDGVPLGTVKSRIRAGLAQLRTILIRLEPDITGHSASERGSNS